MELPPSTKPFSEALRDALSAEDKSQNQLAEELGLDRSFFSKAARRASGKRLRVEQMRDIGRRLGREDDYFREVREAWLIDRMRADPDLALWLYEAAKKRLGED